MKRLDTDGSSGNSLLKRLQKFSRPFIRPCLRVVDDLASALVNSFVRLQRISVQLGKRNILTDLGSDYVAFGGS